MVTHYGASRQSLRRRASAARYQVRRHYTLTAKIQVLNQMESVAPPDDIVPYGNNGKFVTVQDLKDPTGYQWFTLTGTLMADSSMVGIGLDFGSIFTGTILVDEVTLTPP